MSSAIELEYALTELDQLDHEMARRKRTQGIQYWVPNAPQLKALQSPAREVLYVGGNRAGKSTLGAAVLVSHLIQRYGSCPCHGTWLHPDRQLHRPIKAVVVATEYPIIERVIEPKIMSLLPHAMLGPHGVKRTPQSYLRRLVLTNGSTVDILTTEMDQMAFESADWDYAWIDEPTQQSKYLAIQRGLLDRRGSLTMTFTPLTEAWLKEQVIDKRDGRTIEVVEADTYANTHDIHGTPILTTEAIKAFEDKLPEEERATRIHGHFFHLRGMVYKTFHAPVHVKEVTYEYPDPVIAVLDPHDRIPHHVIWAFVDRRDWLFIDQELVMEGTVKQLASAILKMEVALGYRMQRRLIDPNFGRKPLITTGRTVIQELQSYGVAFGEAHDDVATGILAVKDYLHYKHDQPLGLTNSPRLYFHPRCRQTIHSVRNLQYEEWTSALRDQRDAKERIRDHDDHGADCIRYLCISRPRFDRLHAPVTSGLESAVY